jgi:hypothetical protein
MMGMLTRRQECEQCKVRPERQADTLQAQILKQVEHGLKLFTDESPRIWE